MPVPIGGHTYPAPLKSELPRGPLKSTSEYALEDVQTVVESLCTDITTGLHSSNAMQRQEIYGRNVLESEAEENLVVKFVKSIVTNSMVMLLLGSAGVSVLVGNWDDAFSITLAILIVSTVGFVQEYRSEKSLEALTMLVPNFSHVVRDGESAKMLADHLVPGDVVKLATGDRVPADVRLVSGSHLEMDESALTGESEALSKTAERMDHHNHQAGELTFSERRNIGFMGTLVRNGHGVGVVVRTGSGTEFGKIHAMMKDIEEPRTPLQRDMDKLGQQLSVASFGVISVIMVIGLVQGKGWLEMFTIGVSLAVAAIPEGLPIVVTVTLALGVFKMARRKAICRKLPSVETLGAVSVVCADKTGTLTMNRMEVEYLYTVADGLAAVKADALDALAQTRSYAQLLRTGNVCNNASTDERGAFIGQATDVAILDVALRVRAFDERARAVRLGEEPFSSETKLMQVTVDDGSGSGPELLVKGALEAVLARCTAVHTASGRAEPLGDAALAGIAHHAGQLAQRGLRVVAAASGAASAAPAGLAFGGLFVMRDPPRATAARTVAALAAAGVRTVMITGDALATAAAVARSIGIAAGDGACVAGAWLDALDDAALAAR
ncbi:High affinity Ca2+/Mn2+ P-type ATPase-like protein, partial [Coemansia sp. RSA 2052]